MTPKTAQLELLSGLKKIYDDREAVNIADWVMEHITGRKKIDRLIDNNTDLTDIQLHQLKRISGELANHRPVQYVLGEAWFAGMKFYVNEQVLIPRPETEELVDWIAESQKAKVKSKNKQAPTNQKPQTKNQKQPQTKNQKPQTILDIGTGSGCIPITLQKRIPGADIISIDISGAALAIAKKNADLLGAEITLMMVDFLDEFNWQGLPVVDLIVSNPPYIKQSEYTTMARNVLNFEPSIALFVPDDDPLLFYKKIAVFAKTHLLKEGSIFLEINEALGDEVSELFKQFGYVTELRKDLQGQDRMLRAALE